MNCFFWFGGVEMELSSRMTQEQIRFNWFTMSCRIASAQALDKTERKKQDL
jgi:hypothetical protein